jgi:NAD(P)-dependent dehydrogenase (short-subunit alcohol dehydrogenase family)
MGTRPLTGKWALVTGASRGIGQQISLGLAEYGCNLILHARRLENLSLTAQLARGHRVHVSTVSAELADPLSVACLIDDVMRGPGRVDILYNNAAIQNAWKPVWEISRDEWLETFQVNFFALVALCNAFVPGMRQRGYGRVINLTSGIKDVPSLSPYSTSKAAVDKYTLDLAAELRGTNVLVNTLDPGWLQTDMGGPEAEHPVHTVLPGALVPALLEDFGPSGRLYSAQDFKYLASG